MKILESKNERRSQAMQPTAAVFSLFLSGVFTLASSLSWQYFYVSQSMSWSDAQTYCRTNYIDLVTVRNLSDSDAVIALAASSDPAYTGAVWLGLRRTWTWATGELYTGQVAFKAYQPNEGNDGAACAVIDSYGMGDWFCSTTHDFVCYDDTPNAAETLVMISNSMNWTDANVYCQNYFAELATIKTQQDLNQVISMLSNDAFVGLISGQWSDSSFFAFRYWTGSSSQESSLIDECVAMEMSNSGHWNNYDCTLRKPFICYGDPPVQPVSRLYYSVRNMKKWSDAQIYCRTRFTDLATVDSVDDVYSVMDQVDPRYTGLVWLGLHRTPITTWTWSMGNEPLSDYLNWADGTPYSSGKCGFTLMGFWINYDCQTLQYFVCYSEGTGYVMVKIDKTWPDAQSYCRSTYTDLASIRSPWEQNQVNKVTGRWDSAWIGLVLDDWTWSDQWSRRFRNWESGPPAVGTGACGAVVAGHSGRWRNDFCTTAYPFVCYGVDKMKKKQVMRVKLSSDGTTDWNDLSVQAAILHQIVQQLKANGLTKNVTVSWRVSDDGSIFKKVFDLNGFVW